MAVSGALGRLYWQTWVTGLMAALLLGVLGWASAFRALGDCAP